MICTNVPGPQQPLYLLGHKMLRAYPYVPIGGEMGVNVAILSYDGTAYVGFGGDVHAVPDIDRFEKLLRVSFKELREAAVGKTPRRKVSATKTKVAASPQGRETQKDCGCACSAAGEVEREGRFLSGTGNTKTSGNWRQDGGSLSARIRHAHGHNGSRGTKGTHWRLRSACKVFS